MSDIYTFVSNVKTDHPTVNGRIYPKDEMEKSLNKFMGQDFRPVTLGYRNTITTDCTSVSLANVCGNVETYQITDDGEITLSVKILDTPKGLIAKQQIASGMSLGISHGGIGKELNHVVRDLTIHYYDISSNPAKDT